MSCQVRLNGPGCVCCQVNVANGVALLFEAATLTDFFVKNLHGECSGSVSGAERGEPTSARSQQKGEPRR